jgi:hypothetical protein
MSDEAAPRTLNVAHDKDETPGRSNGKPQQRYEEVLAG